MAKAPAEIRSLARSYTTLAINTLKAVAGSKKAPPAARVMAAKEILDRGWGKAAQPLTGADGSEDIQVTIRTIIGKKE